MTHGFFVLALLVFVSSACADGGEDADRDASPDAGGDADTDADADADAGPDSGSDPAATCGADSSDALAACVDEARFAEDLASFSIERPPGSAGWSELQSACFDRLVELGFEVVLEEYDTGVNVVGRLWGESEPDAQIVVGAHYDHIEGCPGADDNATGVAAALETARVLSSARFERTLVVACWDEEELGTVGSEAFVASAVEAETAVDVAVVFEMIGYASDEPGSQTLPSGFELVFPEQIAEILDNDSKGDFVAIVADENAEAIALTMEQKTESAGIFALPLVLAEDWLSSSQFQDLRRSDHDPFWQAGYPAIMLTDTSNFRYAAYHCMSGDDVPANLDTGFASAVVRGAVAAVSEALGIL